MDHLLKMTSDGFPEWKNYLLEETKRQAGQLSRIEDRLGNIEREIAKLKIQSGVWGASASLIAVGIFLAYQMITK